MGGIFSPIFYINNRFYKHNKNMKNTNRNKKALSRVQVRNTHKRRAKEKAKNELLKILEQTNIKADSLRISDTVNLGRRGRITSKSGKDEIRVQGVFSSSKSGYGFVTPENSSGERDIFIPEDKTLGAIDGDVVEIIYHSYSNRFGEAKTEGRVTKILEYGRKTVIGTLVEERSAYRNKYHTGKKLFVLPDDPSLFITPRVRDGIDAKAGDKVEALLIRESGIRGYECTVVRSFGDAKSRQANYQAILSECEITVDFTSEELAEAELFANMPLTEEGRVRRSEVIFTIDGIGAKDLDDAVSLRRMKGGFWQLGVHIADVSHYVRERTHLDRAAMARGTSVYFTDKVVPMLPPSLSNGACSLNPGEEKYTLSAIIDLTPQGEIRGVRIEPSIIKSRVRGVYSEVNEIFSGTAAAQIKAKYRSVIPSLMRMRELYLVLKEKSEKRGALELESAEAEIVLGEDGMPIDIVKRERGDAEKLIEQFMITANEAVAKYLSDKEIPCVYRIHENPPPEKLADFLNYVHNLGFDTRSISFENSTPKDFSSLLSEAQERGLIRPVSYTMLRSMSKARYSELRKDHFGLGLKYYCHFTSPIRRLSDLATHRIIHSVLLNQKRREPYAKYAKRAAAAATDAELRAIGAERRIENLYKVLFMQDKIGECFDAVINSVTSFGFFAELDNTCEGLVPISELSGMFIFDERNLTLRSRDVMYRVGDTVRVQLEEADIIRGKLRFSVVDTELFKDEKTKGGGSV